jgi:predicted MFS family arabinose efflux permease
LNQPDVSESRLTQKERLLVWTVGAVQFVNILDFMMVMPLGPDFAKALHVPTSVVGAVGGTYTAAAAIAGMVGSLFLDRFERRRALTVLMLGLALATALGGLAWDLPSLLGARVLAGAFGGPATSIALAIISDVVPPVRRGRAMGGVMTAFSLASIFGVPAGLELGQRFGFRVPFLAVGGLGLLVTFLALTALPELRGHIARGKPTARTAWSRTAIVSLSSTAVIMLGVFSVVPSITAFLQFNLNYPRDDLGMLYLVGGVLSFIAVRLVGSLVDRLGALPIVIVGTAIHAFALSFGFIWPTTLLPILLVFAAFMVSGSVRMVPLQTLSSRIPAPNERARFMSAQSAVQHIASAAGAFLSSAFLKAEPSGRLIGMEAVAGLALALALVVPFLCAYVEQSLKRQAGAAPAPVA